MLLFQIFCKQNADQYICLVLATLNKLISALDNTKRLGELNILIKQP